MKTVIVTFIEGVAAFISPCVLPLLPVYVSYFAAGADKKRKVFLRALAFVVGFTAVFTLLGVFAGSAGAFLAKNRKVFDAVCGVIIILFGLSYLGVIRLPLFKGMKEGREVGGVISAFIFGVVFSVSLTPCGGAFLGAALMQAARESSWQRGALLLVVYSLGLGLPLVISALLIDKLAGAFNFIKKHYKAVNTVCGVFLIVVGVVMAFGGINAITSVFS